MDFVEIAARVCYSAIFILSGINHFLKLEMMTQYAESKKVPMPKLMVILTGAAILYGGFSVLFNYQVQCGAPILIGFLLLAAFKMHNFWAVTDPMAKAGEMASFMKNVSLAGATYFICCSNAGVCLM
ncbi:MAG: DoxX family protein [Bacteroidetes bacterium]|nr:DoxX family protein [Bacteroidota bacterium]